MNNLQNQKLVVIIAGAVAALFAVSFIVRLVLLSQYGFAGSWVYFGLPIGGIGLLVLLLRLGVLNFGQKSGGTTGWPQLGGWQASPPPAATHPAAQSLSQLDALRSSGAISEAEYNTRREAIISNV